MLLKDPFIKFEIYCNTYKCWYFAPIKEVTLEVFITSIGSFDFFYACSFGIIASFYIWLLKILFTFIKFLTVFKHITECSIMS